MNLRSGRVLSDPNATQAPTSPRKQCFKNAPANCRRRPTSGRRSLEAAAAASHYAETGDMDDWFNWTPSQPAHADLDLERGEGAAHEETDEERRGREYAASRTADLTTGASLTEQRRLDAQEASRLESRAHAAQLAENRRRSAAEHRRTLKDLKRQIEEAERRRRISQREEAIDAMCSRMSRGLSRCCTCSWCSIVVAGTVVVCCFVVGVLVGKLQYE